MRQTFLLPILLLLAALICPRAFGQTCDHYLNATDGIDPADPDPQTAGTTPIAAFRSFEYAFRIFPSGSIVCTTAGEYFRGMDANGIQLNGGEVQGKSMTFVLQSFGTKSDVAFTEDSLLVDIGEGTITFVEGTTRALRLGAGVVNNTLDYPTETNFLHTFELLSGVIDVRGVDFVIADPVGNTSFIAAAAIVRGSGSLLGSPLFSGGSALPRVLRYVGEGDRTAGPEVPPSVGRLIFAHSSGRVTIGQPINFADQGFIGLAGAGLATIQSPVTISGVQSTAIQASGGGRLEFTSGVTLNLSGDVDQLLNIQGSGSLTLGDLTVNGAHSATIENRGVLAIESIPMGSTAALTVNNIDGEAILGRSGSAKNLDASLTNASGALMRLLGTTSVGGSIDNDGSLVLEGTARIIAAGASVSNDGQFSSGGSLTFTGTAQTLSGSGTLGNVTIDLPSEDNDVTVQAGTLHQTGALTITRGQLTVALGATYLLSDEEGVPSIRRNLADVNTDTRPDGKPVMANASGSGTFGTGGSGFNLEYFGGMTGRATLDASLAAENIVDLRIAVESIGADTPVIELPADASISGDLEIVAGAELDLGGHVLVATGTGSIHTITGSLVANAGAFVISGGGTVEGNPAAGASTIENLTLRSSGNVVVRSLEAISGTLRVESGSAEINLAGTQEPGRIGILRQTAASELILAGDVLVEELATLTAGSLNLGSFELVMDDSAAFTAGGNAEIIGSGGVVFSGTGSLAANGVTIPRLLLRAATTDAIRLTGNIHVGHALVHQGGTLDLQSFQLIHEGSIWNYSGGAYSGAGRVILRGEIEGQFESPVSVPNLIIEGEPGLSTLTLGSHSVTVEDSLAFTSGLVDLGNQDLVVQGAFHYDAGAFTTAASDTFRHEPVGELVLDGAGIGLANELTIDYLRVRGNSEIRAESAPIRIQEQIAFEAGHLLGVTADNVRIESGARIVREGAGTFGGAPFFGSALEVRYELDGSEVGVLSTGAELPERVRSLVINAGANAVTLASDVRVDSTLLLRSGVLTPLETLTVGKGGAVQLAFDGSQLPKFEGASYITAGPITLIYSGTSGDLASSNLSFPSSSSIQRLIIRMGDATTNADHTFSLHANRRVSEFVVDNMTDGSEADLNGKTLIVEGNASVNRGRLNSETEALLEVRNRLEIGRQAVASGMLVATVDGRVDVDGAFEAYLLRARGDVVVRGRLGGRSKVLDAGAEDVNPGLPNLEILGSSPALRFENNDGNASTMDDAVNELIVRTSGSDGTVFFVARGDTAHTLGVNRLVLDGGIIVTGRNDIRLPANGKGFERSEGVVGHVFGRVSRRLPAGTPVASSSSRFDFPVGTSGPGGIYRPLSVTFTANDPLAEASTITVSHTAGAAGGYRGFPMDAGDGVVIGDASAFRWAIESSSTLPASQSFTLAVVGAGFDAYSAVRELRLIRRRAGDPAANAWRVQGATTQYDNASVSLDNRTVPLVQAVGTGADLGGTATIFSIGIAEESVDFARLQIINVLDRAINVLLDGSGVSSVMAGSAGAYLRVPAGRHALSLRVDSISVQSDSVTLSPGRDYIALAYEDMPGARKLALLDSARATPALGDKGVTSLAFLNGIPDAPPLSMNTNDELIADFREVPFGVLSRGYVTLPADETSFSVRIDGGGPNLLSTQSDLAPTAGLTVVAVAWGLLDPGEGSSSTDFALITNHGDRLPSSVATAIDDVVEAPETFILHGNYPNPFNPTTQITFDLPQPADITVELYDMLGRRLRRIGPRSLPAGSHRHIEVDGRGLASGVYVYRIVAETIQKSHIRSGKMTLIK